MIKRTCYSILLGLVLLFALSACNLPLNTPTAAPPILTPTQRTPTSVTTLTFTRSPSPSPMIMCTPPLCWSDESYTCGKTSCPGGCGTVCATKTPDPKASPTPTFPAIANLCRLPTSAPPNTAPKVMMCVSTGKVKVGEAVHFNAAVSPTQAADFNVQIKEEKGSLSFTVSATNRVRGFSNSLQSLTLVAYRVLDGKLTVMLTGRAAGTAEITVAAVNLPGGALYTSKFILTVAP